jgi:hypothetical protein
MFKIQKLIYGGTTIEIRKENKKRMGISSFIIYGLEQDKNRYYPILYIKKPRWQTEEEFQKIIDNMTIFINTNQLNETPTST